MEYEKSINNENNDFTPVQFMGDDVFLGEFNEETGNWRVLQLACETDDEIPVGMPFYEFFEVTNSIVKKVKEVKFRVEYREIGYDRWVRRDDEFPISLLGNIKETKEG